MRDRRTLFVLLVMAGVSALDAVNEWVVYARGLDLHDLHPSEVGVGGGAFKLGFAVLMALIIVSAVRRAGNPLGRAFWILWGVGFGAPVVTRLLAHMLAAEELGRLAVAVETTSVAVGFAVVTVLHLIYGAEVFPRMADDAVEESASASPHTWRYVCATPVLALPVAMIVADALGANLLKHSSEKLLIVLGSDVAVVLGIGGFSLFAGMLLNSFTPAHRHGPMLAKYGAACAAGAFATLAIAVSLALWLGWVPPIEP